MHAISTSRPARHRLAVSIAMGLAAGAAFVLARALLRGGPRDGPSGDIIANASEAIISIDANMAIVLVNRAAARMFDTDAAKMQGVPLARFVRPLPTFAPNGAPAYFGSSGGVRRASDAVVTGTRADGSTFPLEGSVSGTAKDGQRITTLILRDVTERQQVQDKLARSHAQLRQLSAALQTIREEERTRIARELHDDLGQLLASLRMDLTWLQQAGDGAASAAVMATMEHNLLTAIASLRRIASNLRPRALDEGGLFFALQGLCNDFSARYGIGCELYADEAELRLDDRASTAIFRIVQEALTNIARHAQARNVTVNVYRIDSELLMTIRDDGRGISPEDMEKAESLGLIGMRERVWGMQGDISIGADEPPGTRIDIVLPLAGHAQTTAPPP